MSRPRRSPRSDLLPENSRIVHPSFLEKHSNKRDLQKRLVQLLQLLRTDESIEPHSPDWPGLAATAHVLLQYSSNSHSDKQVRLLSLANILELLAIYAPELPYDDAEMLQIFEQLTRQLANLATSPSNPYLQQMLELLATVKIGTVLVDMVVKGKDSHDDDDNDDDDDDDGTNPSTNALEVLVDFIHTLLHSLRSEHSSQILELCQEAIGACLEEFDDCIDSAVLEELLLAVAAGPTQLVTVVPTHGGGGSKKPKQVPEPNPTYKVAAQLIRQHWHRWPLTPFLQKLLQGGSASSDSRILHLPPSAGEEGDVDVYTILVQLLHICPNSLVSVLGTVAAQLTSSHPETRLAATTCLGQIWSAQPATVKQYAALYRTWWQRRSDAAANIRLQVVKYGVRLLPAAAEQLVPTLQDPDKNVRLEALHSICDALYNDADCCTAELLQAVKKRVRSKDAQERKDALTGVAQIYARRCLQPHLKDLATSADNGSSVNIKALLRKDSSFDWVPACVWQAALQFPNDTALQHRLWQLVDQVWWSQLPTVRQRAVGWLLVLQQGGPWQAAWQPRAALQASLEEYMEARARRKKCTTGTEQALAADAQAMELLHRMAQYVPVKDESILDAVHGIRDQHFFRILGRLADPTHSPQARTRALEELPKRAPKNTVEWVQQLVRRCAMGSLNAETVQECVVLAAQAPVDVAVDILAMVQEITDIFPSLVAGSADTLISLLDEPTLVTPVTAILAECAKYADWEEDQSKLQMQLKTLCCKTGSPEQARHAAMVLSHVTGSLAPLVQSLTSVQRLQVNDGTVRILSALTAVAASAPNLFESKKKALTFALEGVLMGRVEACKTPSKKKSPRKPHETPKAMACLLEDESLSMQCRQMCAAMEFLVTWIRSTLLQQQRRGAVPDIVPQVFAQLAQILHDKGLPGRTRQDRAALRRCAAIHLFRLCDTRLGLEKVLLTATMWHTLSQSVLDEEYAVREIVLEELVAFLTGAGVYGKEKSRMPAKAPPLRFVSLVTLCSDGDHGSEHDGANGNAANVGKLMTAVKDAALRCVIDLRKVSDAMYAQCRAQGDAAVKRFETQFKMMVMPEYMVPYAIHLLTHRNESPFEDDNEGDDSDSEGSAPRTDDASRQRVLRKRLKLLFDPLVHSLGDSADNISFLLRMVEILGKNYRPVDVSSFGASSLTVTSPGKTDNAFTKKRSKVLREKLKVICGVAREVLLSFVKKDVNLTTYPGTVQLPRTLFQRVAPVKVSKERSSIASSVRTPGVKTPPVPKSILAERPLSDRKRPAEDRLESARKSSSRVHFSPDVVQRSSSRRHGNFSRGTTPDDDVNFGDVSPIAASKSPGSMGGDATLGTTPPSTLRGATLPSTAPDGSTTSEEGNSPASRTRSSTQSRASSTQSPIVLEQILKDSSGDELQTTSETPQSPIKTQESSEANKVPSKRRNRRRQIPSHIEISHEKPTQESSEPTKKRRRRGSTKSTPVATENRPLTRNRRARK